MEKMLMPKLPESRKEIYDERHHGPANICLGDEYWTVDKNGDVPTIEKHKVVEITKSTKEYTTEAGTESKIEYRYRLDSGRMFQNPFTGVVSNVYKRKEEAFEEYENELRERISEASAQLENLKESILVNTQALLEFEREKNSL